MDYKIRGVQFYDSEKLRLEEFINIKFKWDKSRKKVNFCNQ